MSGMVGGTDLIFETARRGFDARPILDAVLDVWPDGLFQDAEEDDIRPLADALADPRTGNTREFFTYRDRASADRWQQDGWTHEYGDALTHFLVTEDAAHPDVLRLTLVIGSATDETIRLIAAVSDALSRMAVEQCTLQAPSRRIDWEAELRAAGYTAGKEEFYAKVEELSAALFPDWSADELACHPHEALQFCEIVRRVVAPVPDHLVMKALLNRRKQRRKVPGGVVPRLLWGA